MNFNNKIKEERELQREISLLSATNIVIANMIGAGIFTTSGLLMKKIPNPGVILLLWVAGGIVALCGSLSYSLLGSRFPLAGGEYIYLSKLFHPILGFLSGWLSFFVGFSAPISASAIGFTEYLARAFPKILNPGIFDSHLEHLFLKKFYSVLVILIFTIIHSRGVSLGTSVQNFLTFLKIGLILSFIIAGFFSDRGNLSHFTIKEGISWDLANIKSLALSLMWITFAYSGWNASSYIGAEIKNPSRNLPISLFLGTSIVLLLYFLMNFIYIYAIRPEEMKGVISVGGLAMKNLFGEKMETLSSVLISFALFSSLSAFVILGPRVYYAMAKDGYFFKFASEIHPMFKVPSKSIVLQGIISIIILLSGTFEQILTYMSFSLGIFPIIAVVGVFKIKREYKEFKIPFYPLPPLIFIVSFILILSFGFLESPIPSLVAMLTVLAGIPFYFIFEKIRKEK